MIGNLSYPDHDDDERGHELQRARGAGGNVGEIVGAQAGASRLLDPRLPALLDLGLEAKRLDGGGIGHGLGEGRALGRQRLEVFVSQTTLRAMAGERHADQHGNGKGHDEAKGRADPERGGQEEHDEQEVDRQHRHLTGEEAAQHIELAQTFGDDTRRRALEMPIGQSHQVMQHLGAHQRIETRAGPGRQPAARDTQTEIGGVGCKHARAEHRHHRPEALGRLAGDHRVDHQHHEERREQAQHVDEERRGGKLEDDRPHTGP